MDISPSGDTRVIPLPTMQIGDPHVSADGKKLAFLGGLRSDQGQYGGDVFITDLASGATRNITEGFAGTFGSINWTGNFGCRSHPVRVDGYSQNRSCDAHGERRPRAA